MDVLALFNLFNPQQVQGWFEWGGYFILFGLLFACGLGLPLPEDIPLLVAGFFVAQPEGAPGKMHLLPAAIIAWCGIIGGDCVLYSLGRRFGLEITRVPFVGKHVTRNRILKAESLFEKYGIWVVAFGRMLAGIRGAMVVAAGAIRFNFVRFVIADGLAAIVSGGLFLFLGHLAGKKLGTIEQMRAKVQHYEYWVFAALGVVVALTIAFTWWRKRHSPADEVGSTEPQVAASAEPDAKG